MKQCYSCKITKPLSEYHNDKSKKDGKVGSCKPCKASYIANYYKNNSEKMKSTSIKHYYKNREEIRERMREYYLENIEEYRERRKKQYWANREENIAKSSKYHLERLKDDGIYRLKVRCRKRIWAAFKESGYTKRSRTFDIIGCSQDELVEHLESKFTKGMSWGNYGEWHVDHIIPFAAATTEEEVIALCHYSNLQPLWGDDNIRKSARFCEEEFEKYLSERLP